MCINLFDQNLVASQKPNSISRLKKIHPKLIRQLLLLILILFFGWLIFDSMLPYISGVLGALTLYVILRKWMKRLQKTRLGKRWSAIILITLATIGICIPLSGAIYMLGFKIGNLADKSEQVISAFKEQVFVLEKHLGYDISNAIDPQQASGWVTDNFSGFASGTLNIVVSIGVLLIILYYMLIGPKEMRDSLMEYIPLSNKTLVTLGNEIDKVVRSNAIAIPLVAIAQGIIALIGFFIFDIDNPWFWFVIVTIGSMIPFIGTFVGIFPVFVLSLASGNDFQAWGIFIYGMVVVGSTDNLIRLLLLQKLDSIHPLITLIGVLLGIPLFGFVGLIFGPLIVNLFLVLLKVYKEQYGLRKSEESRQI
ncbi:AI-2E family transporter [Maribacter aurantiacus]|uniref:AI-2E family transporter n=1 Tax=Maribacter aurantiacus TaxID=1882343 RepID=UPI0026C2B336|nr:AI-2E family transporter [Maribacter aurantiacus]